MFDTGSARCLFVALALDVEAETERYHAGCQKPKPCSLEALLPLLPNSIKPVCPQIVPEGGEAAA